ncbi:MAG: putative zinc-binding protein [Chloroflexia bacterium]
MGEKNAGLPPVGLFACFSGGSNSGSLAGLAALEAVRVLGSDRVGICSLPAILNQVPRQSALVHKIGRIVVVDGCHNACARQLLAGVGIQPDAYLNLEEDLGIAKKGPFTSLDFTDQEVRAVAEALIALLEAGKGKGEPGTSG